MKRLFTFVIVLIIAALVLVPLAHAFHHSEEDCEICAFIFSLRAKAVFVVFVLALMLTFARSVSKTVEQVYYPVFDNTRLNI